MRAFIITAVIGVTLWGLQAVLAHSEGMLTYKQMKEVGFKEAIPFTGHGSTWFVLFGLIPLVAYMVGEFGKQWTDGPATFFAVVGGLVISGAMHFLYTKAPYSDYMQISGSPTPAFWVHFALFSGAVTVILLFYFATIHFSPYPVLFTTWYLIGHVFVGNHQATKMDPPSGFPPYALSEFGPWAAVIGAFVLLSLASWFALHD